METHSVGLDYGWLVPRLLYRCAKIKDCVIVSAVLHAMGHSILHESYIEAFLTDTRFVACTGNQKSSASLIFCHCQSEDMANRNAFFF